MQHTITAVFLLSHYKFGAKSASLRLTLKEHGVAKGTISKCVTVMDALIAKKITPEQVTSLNAAYNLCKPDTRTYDELVAARDALNKLIEESWVAQNG